MANPMHQRADMRILADAGLESLPAGRPQSSISAIKLVSGAVAGGCVATFVMDAFNRIGASLGLIGQIHHNLIGRLLVAWGRGGFWFKSPADVPPLAGAVEIGYLFHYAIGIFFFAAYVLVFGRRQRLFDALVSAVVFGLATSIVALLAVFPSMGFGWFGLKAPLGGPLLTTLCNHTFYGFGGFLGLAAGSTRGSATDQRYPGSTGPAAEIGAVCVPKEGCEK